MRQPRKDSRRGKEFTGRLRFDMAYRHRWNRFRLEHLVARLRNRFGPRR